MRREANGQQMKRLLFMPSIVVATTFSFITGCTTSTEVAVPDGSTADGSMDHGSPADAAPETTDGGLTAHTFQTGVTQLAAGAESFECQDFANPFGEDVAVIWAESDIDAAAHHLYVFLLPGLTDGANGPCEFGGAEYHDHLEATQAPHERIVFPDGVGRVIPSGVGFRLNVHLLNTSSAPVDAAARLRVEYTSPNKVAHRAYSLFLNDTGLKVPIGQSTITRSFVLPYAIELLSAAGHMHLRGKHFVASADGHGFLDITSSQEPVAKTFEPPLDLAAGTTIDWACTFENDSGRILTYGQSATDEMCAMAGVFYPRSVTATDIVGP
jgi:hypothetical protein